MLGGGQESGLRSGTEGLPAIAAFAAACRAALPKRTESIARQRRLLAQAQELRERIADLDAREPADMMSAQYERWAARHEALEDALDDILDLLDE